MDISQQIECWSLIRGVELDLRKHVVDNVNQEWVLNPKLENIVQGFAL